jgi:hypothetical protein
LDIIESNNSYNHKNLIEKYIDNESKHNSLIDIDLKRRRTYSNIEKSRRMSAVVVPSE